MKSHKRRNQNWGLVLFSVGLVVLLSRYDFSEVNRKPQALNVGDQFPDWTMKHSIAEQFDENGLLNMTIFSSNTQFFKHNNTAEMISPKFQLYGAEQWQVSADRGRVVDKTTLVLNDNVLLERPQQYQTLQTQSLVALFDAQILYTDADVTLRAPNGVATATGMQADWQFQVLELLDNVKLTVTPR